MKNKIILLITLILLIIFIIAIFSLNNNDNSIKRDSNNDIQNIENNIYNVYEGNIINEIKESEIKMNTTIKININNKTFNAVLEQNETAKQFANMLPQSFNMSELNGNEKYVYLDTTLPTDSFSPKHIKAGDIMLYGNNCLVVFYKSFETSYSYTKIGHIENFEDLGNNDITIIFEKI